MRKVLTTLVLATFAVDASGDISLDALRATIRIEGGGQSGTAFLVAVPGDAGDSGTTLLVTAAHVLEKMKGDSCAAAFRASEHGEFVRREARVAIRDNEQPLWTRHPDADVVVMRIEPPADADIDPFTVAEIADAPAFARAEVAVGQPVWVACFPAKTEANPTGWPILRRGTVASHPLSPVEKVKTLFVDYAHFGGDSGSAVVVERDGRPLVAGVVVAMQRQTDQVTSPFEEKKVHTPLGLAIVVPADRLVRTIDLWRESRGRSASRSGG